MKILKCKKRPFGKAGISLLLLVLISLPETMNAQGEMTELEYQRSQKVQSYIDNYSKFYGTAQPVLEKIRSEHQDFYGMFGDSMTALDIYIKLSNGEDWKAAQALANTLSGKFFDQLVERGFISANIKGTLTFFTTAKAAMQLFKDFVFDPYLMSTAVDYYYDARENKLLSPEDAIVMVRAEGNIREQLLKEFEKKYGKEPFVLNSLNLIDESGHELKNDYWKNEFQKFRVEFFEEAYKQRKFLELKEEIERKKNELEGEVPALESRMDEILEEILNSVKTLRITPQNSTLDIGESVEFTVTATTYRGTETDVTSEALTSESFIAETPGDVTITAIYEGEAATANITVNESEKIPESLIISPSEASLKIGETEMFSAVAVFDDESTTDITELATWSSGSSTFTASEAGQTTVTVSYLGLSASAVVKIEEENTGQCSTPSEVLDEETGSCECNTAEGYERNEKLGKCINLDEAIEETTAEENALCDEDALAEKLARLGEIAASGNRLAADFQTMLNKFMKEINDQITDPCTNNSIAYTYASAKETLAEYQVMADEATGVGTDLMLEGAICPLEELELDVNRILQNVSQVGQPLGKIEEGVAEMEFALSMYGCDDQEVSDRGDIIADRTTNPEVIESGGVGTMGVINSEEPGGPPGPGGDNSTRVIIEALYGGVRFPLSSINISVQLNTTSLNFTLSQNGVDFRTFENISLKEGDYVQINVPGTGLTASIILNESDFYWTDPNTGDLNEIGNGKRIFTPFISVFYGNDFANSSDPDEIRWRMNVFLKGDINNGRTLRF